MVDQDVAEIAGKLSASAIALLIAFKEGEARPCKDMPLTSRVELFRRGLLIGAETRVKGRGSLWGAKLNPLGLAVRAHLKGQEE